LRICGGIVVSIGGLVEKCGGVLGPQLILHRMQPVLHEYDSLANFHMQADLHNLQVNLRIFFATRVDCQPRLQIFLQRALRFLRGLVGVVGNPPCRVLRDSETEYP